MAHLNILSFKKLTVNILFFFRKKFNCTVNVYEVYTREVGHAHWSCQPIGARPGLSAAINPEDAAPSGGFEVTVKETWGL